MTLQHYKNKLKLYNGGLFTDEILFGLTAHEYGIEILELKKGKPWNEMTEKNGLNIRESQFLFHSNFISFSEIIKLNYLNKNYGILGFRWRNNSKRKS